MERLTHVFSVPAIAHSETAAAPRISTERLIDSLPALIAYIDAGRKYIYVNRAYALGYAKHPSEIKGRSLKDIIGEAEYRSIESKLDEALDGREVSFEHYMFSANGDHRYLQSTYTPETVNGIVNGIVAHIVDITEQKRKEQEMFADRGELEDFLENAPVGIHKVDASGRIVYANRAEIDMLGYTREEYIGSYVRDFHVRKEAVDTFFRKLANRESVQDHEAQLLGKDGRVRHVLISANVLWKNGEFIHTRCFTRNITDRKLVEEYLREKNKTLQILNSIGNTISANLDLKKLVQSVTDATTEISGAEFGAFFYKDFDDKDPVFKLHCVSGSHQHRFHELFASASLSTFTPLFYPEEVIRVNNTGNDVANGLSTLLKAQGIEDIPFRSYMVMPVISKNGELFGGLLFGHSSPSVFNDRSEILVESIALQAAIAIDNSRLFEAKQAGEERFRVLAESVPQVIWTACPDGNIDYVNQKWTDYSGQDFTDALDSGWLNIVSPEDTVRTVMTWTNALHTGSVFEHELRLRECDGTYRWHLSRALPIKDKGGNIIKWFGTFTDIHDQKMLNEKKDEFIGIASHELKTPLTSIKAYVQLLERLLAGMNNDTAKTYIAKTQIYIDRLHHLIADLLDVTRIQAGKLKFNMAEFDFDQFLTESIDNMQYTTSKKILLSGFANCIIKADRQRLEQVCTNLLSNAIKYSPKSDRVEIHVTREGNDVKVAVRDYGIGIKKDYLPRIFDRFYRVDGITHQFQGLGIGLYIAHEIIKRHNGNVWAESEEGHGSTFYFTIPVKAEIVGGPSSAMGDPADRAV